jgi:hypothetical protein
MAIRKLRLAVAALGGIALGLVATLVNWRHACRAPESEACVWGRAYLPVSLPFGAAVGLVLGVVAYLIVAGVGRRRGPGQPDVP